jgi:biotin carboxyl carrier protein
MILDLDVDGQPARVRLEPLDGADGTGGRFRVTVIASEREPDAAPRTFVVHARPTELGVSLLHEEDGRAVEAAVTWQAGGEALVQLPHVDVPVVVDGGRSRRGSDHTGHGAGEQRVTAPMPGRVVRVLVRAGDDVSARQGLVVVEAMKMENELGALRAGRIREVAVAQGESVEAGRLLVVVDWTE